MIQVSAGPGEDDWPYGDWTGMPPRALTLGSTKAFPSGIVVSTYKAPGPLLNLS